MNNTIARMTDTPVAIATQPIVEDEGGLVVTGFIYLLINNFFE